jgi:hypothetical protein
VFRGCSESKYEHGVTCKRELKAVRINPGAPLVSQRLLDTGLQIKFTHLLQRKVGLFQSFMRIFAWTKTLNFKTFVIK